MSLTTSEVRALLKLKAERDYLKAQVGLLSKSDSIASFVIKDQAKTIDAWAITNEKTAQDLVKAQEQLNKETARKESWRSAAPIGPLKGTPEIDNAALTAMSAAMSASTSGFKDTV